MELPSNAHPPPVPYISYVHKSGQHALWATYIISVLATLFTAIQASRIHVKHRALHLLALVATGPALYFAMATHSGISYVSRGWNVIDGEERLVLRQLFWARYIGWAISYLTMALAYALLSGLLWVDTILLGLTTFTVTLSMSFGALLGGQEIIRWGWFMHASFFVILGLLILYRNGWKSAKQQHAPVCRHYQAIAIIVIPFAAIFVGTFILGEGAGVISVNTEVIVYAIFDMLRGVMLPVWVTFGYEYDDNESHVTCFLDAWTRVRGGKSTAQVPEGENYDVQL